MELSVNEFLKFNLRSRTQLIYKDGTFIYGVDLGKGIKCRLYNMYGFLTEVVEKRGQVSQITPLRGSEVPEYYLQNIKLDRLF